MTHTDRIAAERARKQRERADRHARGYVWRGLWVRPEIWHAVRAYANKRNKDVERIAAELAENRAAEKERK